MQIPAGSTDMQIPIYARTSTGAALTGKLAADFSLSYRRDGASVTITLSDLTALTDSHTDGGIKEVGNGEYRLDVPDAAFAAGASKVTIGGTVAGGVVLGYPISLDTSGTTGTGSRVVTFTVADDETAAAIKAATVRLYRTGSQDRTGSTSAAGTLALVCDVDATWSYAISHPLYGGATGTVVVDGNVAFYVALTALSWPASTEPDTVTVRWKVKSNSRTTVGLAGASVYVRMKTPPTTDGLAWGKDYVASTTDANGYAYAANVPKGCTLMVRLGVTGEATDVAIPSDATSPYDGGEILGTVP